MLADKELAQPKDPQDSKHHNNKYLPHQHFSYEIVEELLHEIGIQHVIKILPLQSDPGFWKGRLSILFGCNEDKPGEEDGSKSTYDEKSHKFIHDGPVMEAILRISSFERFDHEPYSVQDEFAVLSYFKTLVYPDPPKLDTRLKRESEAKLAEPLAFDSTSNNAIKCPYILTTAIKGQLLSHVYFDMSPPERLSIIDQLVPLMAKLGSISFDKAGNLGHVKGTVPEKWSEGIGLYGMREEDNFTPEQENKTIERARIEVQGMKLELTGKLAEPANHTYDMLFGAMDPDSLPEDPPEDEDLARTSDDKKAYRRRFRIQSQKKLLQVLYKMKDLNFPLKEKEGNVLYIPGLDMDRIVVRPRYERLKDPYKTKIWQRQHGGWQWWDIAGLDYYQAVSVPKIMTLAPPEFLWGFDDSVGTMPITTPQSSITLSDCLWD